jgi:hypothetical protein
MNQTFSPENLKEFKARIRIKYPQLTDSDLQHTEGDEESMFRMLEYKLRKTNQELKKIIADL